MGELLKFQPNQRTEAHQVIGNNALALDAFPKTYPVSEVIFLETKKSPLREQIEYFDKNYLKEGLPRDWWNINNIGFSMKAQMRLLKEADSVRSWAEQAERDLRGFGREYLNQGTVFPFEYEIVDGELIDRKYAGRRMEDTVDEREREGAVKEGVLKIKEHMLKAEDGEAAIIVSPPGWTGLTMDNGGRIVYEDTMVFFIQKEGDKVVGTTLRTDFNLSQARLLIKGLTGQELPVSATVVDCVRAIAFTGSQECQPNSPEELVDVLEKMSSSRFAHKDKTWAGMRVDIGRRQELYEFDERTNEILADFKNYVVYGNHSELELQKALSATLMRLSKYMMFESKEKKVYSNGEIHVSAKMRPMTYGQIVEEVQNLPGCAGGGSSSTSVTSIVERSAVKIDDENWDGETFDKPGPCRLCGMDVLCGPCKVCRTCNEEINEQDKLAQTA